MNDLRLPTSSAYTATITVSLCTSIPIQIIDEDMGLVLLSAATIASHVALARYPIGSR